MKKKYIVAILLGLMTCMLTGCSTDSIPSFHAMLFGEEEYVSLGYDPSDYVTLGKYKNIEVEKSVSELFTSFSSPAAIIESNAD